MKREQESRDDRIASTLLDISNAIVTLHNRLVVVEASRQGKWRRLKRCVAEFFFGDFHFTEVPPVTADTTEEA